MKSQALPNSHFCNKISKVTDSKDGKPTLHSLIANYVLEMSVKLKFQCERFEKKHCFAVVVLNSINHISAGGGIHPPRGFPRHRPKCQPIDFKLSDF